MVSDWIIPLLFLLLALALIALWLRLRARRRAEMASAAEAGGAAGIGETVVDPDQPEVFPPEIMAVREELSRIRAEEEAEAAAKREADAADAPELAPEEEAGEPVAEEVVEEIAEGLVTRDEAEDSAAPDTPADGGASEAGAVLAEEATAEQAERKGEAGEADPAPEAVDDEPEPQVDVAAEEPDEMPSEEEAEEAGDRYDPDGRLILPMATGDVIVATEMPRRLELTVTRQWPVPSVQGFDPQAERLVVLYDGPETSDVVMLPTVDGRWQVSLGGRPVVQVECAAGPEALAGALEINPAAA